MVEIELIYFDHCPSWRTAWDDLGSVLVELDLNASVRLRNLDHLEANERNGFAGSPTIRIEGRDLEGYDGPPVMACRRYLDNEGKGWPGKALLRARLGAVEQ